jgi:hypothetical protein
VRSIDWQGSPCKAKSDPLGFCYTPLVEIACDIRVPLGPSVSLSCHWIAAIAINELERDIKKAIPNTGWCFVEIDAED